MKIFARGTEARDLDDDLPILRPGVMRSARRLGIERARRVSLELALIPSLARREVVRAAQNRHRAGLIGVPMRRVVPLLTTRKLLQPWLVRGPRALYCGPYATLADILVGRVQAVATPRLGDPGPGPMGP